jgi:hypothetical protein
MRVRQVQVRGCLPTLLILAAAGVFLAATVSASLALLGLAVGAAVLAALVRWTRELFAADGARAPRARRRAAELTIDAEVADRSKDGGDRPPKRLD